MVTRRHRIASLLIPFGFAGFAGCERGPVDASSPSTSVVSTKASGGRAALVATISELERVGVTATSSQALLSELRATLARMDGSGAIQPDGAAVYGMPTPAGSSWIWVKPDPYFREVHYKAYTSCVDCYNYDRPYGQMQVRQYAGSVQTLNTSRYFGGYPGYPEGDVTTSVSGAAQQRVVYTDHLIDVYLGPDPHTSSSASSQV
ncbi:MAG TPA: hypothetical protein VF092_28655 [Longimicrobium sp.]